MITLMKQHAITTVMLAAIVSMAVSMLLVPLVAHGAFPYEGGAAMPSPLDAKPIKVSSTTPAVVEQTVDIAQANTNTKALSVEKVQRMHALTGAQVEAILNLLLAFGADKKVIDAVRLSLNN